MSFAGTVLRGPAQDCVGREQGGSRFGRQNIGGKFMVIQHNIAAINSYRNLGTNQSALNKNLEKLSSGYKINRAGDNAAGLAISESMRSQINGLNQATSNANDAIGLIQTAEGALTEVHSMLQRMTTLATQAANGTYNSVARGNIQAEMNDLVREINRVANYTDFNGIKPLEAKNGITYSSDAQITLKTGVDAVADAESNPGVKRPEKNTHKLTFQIGPTAGEKLELQGQSMTASGIFTAAGWTGMDDGVMDKKGTKLNQFIEELKKADGGKNTNLEATLKDWLKDLHTDATDDLKNGHTDKKKSIFYVGTTTTTYANRAVAAVKDAIDTVSTFRAQLGSKQNRLEHTINSLKVTSENITAAESRIRDTDMADEITSYTKNNILLQAAQSMLSQANAAPQGVLSLLQ